ncbi:MAG: hypothetical protein ACE5K3_11195 [bacterium]
MRKSVVMVASAAIALMMSIMIPVAYAPRADAIVIEHTYTFSVGPGAPHWETYSGLSDDVYGSTTGTGYADKFVMTVTGDVCIRIRVVDCCLMGDTIALGKSAKKYWYATSPDVIEIIYCFKAGVYKFFVGYIPPHTGVFPAGYDIYVTYLIP